MACPNGSAENGKEPTLTYENYLNIEKLLSCLQLRCPKFGKYVHDEHLFITMHQAYELWFKQAIHEVDSIREILAEVPFDEKKMLLVNNRMDRINLIVQLMLKQLPILETMSPLSFFNFRDYLAPASGFQSAQFRIFENKMGIKKGDRKEYQKQHYAAQCNPDKQDDIRKAEEEDTLFQLVERWLERTHGLEPDGFNFWKRFGEKVKDRLKDISDRAKVADEDHKPSLDGEYKACKAIFDRVLTEEAYCKFRAEKEHDEIQIRMSHKALQGALMISHYRQEIRFQQSYQFLTKLIDMDALVNKWRYHHLFMVHRMIGAKPGTGGSSGYVYLRSTIWTEKYRIFLDLFNLSNYYLPQAFVPELTPEMKKFLSPPQKEVYKDIDYDEPPGIEHSNRAETRRTDKRDHCSDGHVEAVVFNSLGGKLSTESHGFTLDIPSGALDVTKERITLEVLTRLPENFKLEDDELLVSHGFQCYPSGLRFKKPAKLTIPHCAVLDKPWNIKTAFYSWDSGTQGSPKRFLEPSNTCVVHQHCLEISITHFSGGFFAMIWDWLFVKGIRLSCMPLLPKVMPKSRKPILEVRLVKKAHGQHWREVHQIHERDKHQPAKDNDDVILFKKGKPSLTITCQVEDDSLAQDTVEYDDVRSEPEKTMYFPLNLIGKSEESLVKVNMIQTISQNIAFNTSFSGEGTNERPLNVEALQTAPDAVPGPPSATVSDGKLEVLSSHVPHSKYSELADGLGIEFNEASNILAKPGNDSTKAIRECLAVWKNRTGGSLIELKEILQGVDLGGLIRYLE